MFTEKEGDEVVSAILETLEKSTNKKVLRVMVIEEEEESSAGDSLPAFVLFLDGSILRADISVFPMADELAVRVRGNYL